MKSAKEALKKAKHGPSDVVGIDYQSTEFRLARLRKTEQGVSVVAMESLPATGGTGTPQGDEQEEGVVPLVVPQKFRAKYGALCLPGDSAIVKLLTFPGQFTAEAEEKVVQNLGLEDPAQFRISYKLVVEGHGKSESRVLAVAVPEKEASRAPKFLPAGTPVPFSLEVAPLAALTAFLHGPGGAKDQAVGALEFGVGQSTLALFNKGILVLVRRFPIGSNSVVDKVQESLGVDRETAQGIMSDGAFDISQSINEVMEPLIKQLIVSRDFVERRESCRISGLYVSGTMRSSNDLLTEIKSAVGVAAMPWDPLDGLTIAPDAVPEETRNQSWMFAAAIGACLGVFEDAV